VPRLQWKSFEEPDEVREFPNGRVLVVTLDELSFGVFRFEPGWRWSNDVRPIAETTSCQHRHIGYVISGVLHVQMEDGTVMEIPSGTVYEIPPGHDAWVVGEEAWHSVEFTSARSFGARPEQLGRTTLATLLFTDIVGSTAMLEAIGDARWRELLLLHNRALREQLDLHRGREVDAAGDGLFAMFDTTTGAVRCGQAMVQAANSLDLHIRVGCHTGEVQLAGGRVSGMAVHTAARVMSLAGSDQLFVSATTRDLLSGSGIAVEPLGPYELKGLEGTREIFRVV
jgi:class 3 adenylate cyclase